MATWDTVCEIVGALSGTELEADRQGRPTWRVDGRPILRRFPRFEAWQTRASKARMRPEGPP